MARRGVQPKSGKRERYGLEYHSFPGMTLRDTNQDSTYIFLLLKCGTLELPHTFTSKKRCKEPVQEEVAKEVMEEIGDDEPVETMQLNASTYEEAQETDHTFPTSISETAIDASSSLVANWP